MYKLFVTRITKRIPSHSISYMPKQIIVHRSMRLCSFCNFYHGEVSKFAMHHQSRTMTTTVNVLDQSPVKKKKKRRRKYTEILEVTDEKTSNKRTTIEKLNVNNMFKFVNQSDITVDESNVIGNPSLPSLHSDQQLNPNDIDLKFGNNTDALLNVEMEHFFDNKGVTKSLEACYDIDDIPCQNKTLVTDIPDEEKKVVHVKKKMNKSSKKTKKNKDQKASQEQKPSGTHNDAVMQTYIDRLLTHMQVYLSCGMINRAKRILLKYRENLQHKVKDNCSHIKFYNLLLEAYASKGNVLKALQLYVTIKESSLSPTPQTYTYILDAFARRNKYKHRTAILKELHYEMNRYNISFNDVFNKSYFKNDQRENVLKIVKLLMPKFEPLYATMNVENTTCELLKKIHTKNEYGSPVQGLLTPTQLRNLVNEQIRNELAIEVEIKNIQNDNDKNEGSLKAQKITELENHWTEVASVAFERNLRYLKQKESNTLTALHPFLEVLDRNLYIDAIMREIKKLAKISDFYSPTTKSLHAMLGKYIYNKYKIRLKQQSGELHKMFNIYQKYLQWYLCPEGEPKFSNMNDRSVWQHIESEVQKHGTSLNTTSLKWPTDVITNIGKFLYDIILNDIILQPDNLKGHDFKCSIPAFYTLYRHQGQYSVEQIKPHPIVSKLYKEVSTETILFESSFIPSCSPPRPWTSMYEGSYVITKADFMRVPSYTNSPICKLEEIAQEQLFPVLDSLNQLGSIPWIINSPILDIIIEIFRKGGSKELNVPRSVSVLSPPCGVKKNCTVQEKREATAAFAKYKQERYDVHSIWCETLYKLSIANHFRNKIFWLPHNLDFRGRVYPIPPYLNHLTSDLGRSLLLFAKGKPLGPNGLDWLKVHVINLTGFKKQSSIKDRLEYANQNIENILDSAEKPLTGKMWWLTSSEPWQTLAGCMEIANALKTPNAEEYVSHFPVHQDGSCNGLQHYAALGRDQIGAESVNLYPFDTPNDVYTAVAAIVEDQRQKDAKNNVKIAKILDGFIKRKVIKQTVMTTVYGVTRHGAKLQIAKQLRDIPQFPEAHVWAASQYLTEKTFHSLRTMFKSARQIQDWFNTCAQIISQHCNNNVEWITPLGLPIVQPYIKQRYMKPYMKHDKLLKPDAKKQTNAFAPNFIHSLDSTHMMLTSLYCRESGITFVSVHDCFWTHACTVNIMNRICREQFTALHSEPILDNLSQFFVQRYMPVYEKLKTTDVEIIIQARESFTSLPEKGSFDINNVLKSTYFFS